MLPSEVLHLNLHREPFAEIAAETKRIEYRDRTPYWEKRLENRDYKFIQFRNGYATLAPEMLVEFRGVKKITKWGERFYAISLGRILKIKRWKTKGRPNPSPKLATLNHWIVDSIPNTKPKVSAS